MNIELVYCELARWKIEEVDRFLEELPITVETDSNQESIPELEGLYLARGEKENHYVMVPHIGSVFYGGLEKIDSDKYSVIFSPSKVGGVSLCVKEVNGIEVEFQTMKRDIP